MEEKKKNLGSVFNRYALHIAPCVVAAVGVVGMMKYYNGEISIDSFTQLFNTKSKVVDGAMAIMIGLFGTGVVRTLMDYVENHFDGKVGKRNKIQNSNISNLDKVLAVTPVIVDPPSFG